MEYQKQSAPKVLPFNALTQYEDIRARANRSDGPQTFSPTLFPSEHGFGRLGMAGQLGQRWTGIDKFFYTLVMGVVDDPDFALKKDPRIYDRMLRDPQIYYCLQVRKAAVIGLEWQAAPAVGMEDDPTAKKTAEECTIRLQKIPRFNELLDNILDATLAGLSVNELCWSVDEEGHYHVSRHFPVNKDRVKFDPEGRVRLLCPANAIAGIEVPQYKFISHVYNTTDGSWTKPEDFGYSFFGRGLADTPLYHYFYFKIQCLQYLLKSLERYGNPFILLFTPSQNELFARKLSSVMQALRNDSVVSIPGKKGEVDVEVVRAMAGQNVFLLFLEYVDRLFTRAILGQELMTEMPGQGSYAAAQVHESVFARLVAYDRSLVEDTLTGTLVTYDMQLNAPTLKKKYYPRFTFKVSDVSSAGAFLEIAQKAVDLGLPVPVAQIRQLTGLAAPNVGELAVTPMGIVPYTEKLFAQMVQMKAQLLQQQMQQPQQPGGNGNGKQPSKTGVKSKTEAKTGAKNRFAESEETG